MPKPKTLKVIAQDCPVTWTLKGGFSLDADTRRAQIQALVSANPCAEGESPRCMMVPSLGLSLDTSSAARRAITAWELSVLEEAERLTAEDREQIRAEDIARRSRGAYRGMMRVKVV